LYIVVIRNKYVAVIPAQILLPDIIRIQKKKKTVKIKFLGVITEKITFSAAIKSLMI